MTHQLPRPARRALPRAVHAAFAALLLAPGAGGAQTQDAAVRDSFVVTLTPALRDGALVALDVEMRFRGDEDGWTVFLLPGATARGPRHWETVSDLSFEHATARDHGDDRRILLHAPGARITARYRVTQKFQGRSSVTIIEPDFFSTIGSAVFGDLESRSSRTIFRWGPLPAGWTAASDLDHADPVTGLGWREFYTSTLIGGARVRLEERRTGTGRLRLAMHHDLQLEPARFADLVATVAHVSNRFWNDPGGDYFVSVTAMRGRMQAGLGREDGYALYVPVRPESLELRNTLAHEQLHSWFGSRFGNGNAWFREGFTEYYARLVNLRAGEYTLESFADRWNGALLRYAQSAWRLAPDSVTDAKFYLDADAERIGEDRGSLVAALLDHRLRSATAARVDLRTVLLEAMKEVDARTRAGESGPQRVVRLAREMARVDLQPIVDAHLARGEPIVLPPDLFGSCLSVATMEITRYDRGYARTVNGAIEGVDSASAAWAAGLRDGMTLLALLSGVPDDARVEHSVKVLDRGTERVISWYPGGTEILRAQEVQVVPGLAPQAREACALAITNVDRPGVLAGTAP